MKRRSYHLGHALGLLIEASLECREFSPLPAGLYSGCKGDGRPAWKSHLDQFCTIRMGTSRMAGHTTALVKAAKEFFVKPLIVTPNRAMIKNVKGVALDLGLKDANFVSTEQVNRNFARGIDCDAILVDCAFFLSSGQREAIEEHAMAVLPGYPDFCLIYVQ